jgi:3-oxoacyl-[acyl-carrier-protein] synthase II
LGRAKVVVTGLGAVSPYGVGVDTLWKGLSTGLNAIRTITDFDTSDLCCQVGAFLPPFAPTDYIDRRHLVGMDIFEVIGVMAAQEAFRDSAFPLSEGTGFRVGVIGGSCIGGMTSAFEEMERYRRAGDMRLGVFTVPKLEIDMLPGWAAILLGLKGPNLAVNTACSTGNYALAMARMMVERGDADALLVMTGEKAVTRLSVAGFCRMRALAKMDEDDPTKSLRVFDRRRTGTLFGDGAVGIMLEREADAKARGARIYAEIAGAGMSDDAYHIAAPDPEGKAIVYAMKRAIEEAGLTPNDIDYVSAHGTGTPYNDPIETDGIKKVLGKRAYEVPVSAIKSMVGHQLGTASATQAIAAIMTIRTGIIPPTLHLEEPDPRCDLDYVANHPRQQKVRAVLSNSFGFGGHNACIVIRE